MAPYHANSGSVPLFLPTTHHRDQVYRHNQDHNHSSDDVQGPVVIFPNVSARPGLAHAPKSARTAFLRFSPDARLRPPCLIVCSDRAGPFSECVSHLSASVYVEMPRLRTNWMFGKRELRPAEARAVSGNGFTESEIGQYRPNNAAGMANGVLATQRTSA